MNNRFENGRCGVVVATDSQCRFIELESDCAMTLVATLSDDPYTWSEMEALWPRYRTPVVEQEMTEWQWTSIDVAKSAIVLSEYVDWAFIDLDRKQLVTSESLGLNGSNCVFDLFKDDCEHQKWPLSIHLPPWWEVFPGGSLNHIRLTHQPPAKPVTVDRELLLGSPLIEFIAQRVVEVVSKSFLRTAIVQNTKKLYVQTVAIHRDWLMTPRHELDGRTPRQLLHGAHDWLERVVQGQTLRALAGLPLVAYPRNLPCYPTAPMGSEEVIIYFDLCRHLIEFSWSFCRQWFKKRGMMTSGSVLQSELSNALLLAKQRWLEEPFEGGATPQFILESSRGRVPRSSSYSVEGIDGHQPTFPLIDCDCVVCQMMASGKLGPTVESLDGHHLELDEEFAFSMFETLQQWQEEQELLGCFDNESQSDEVTEEETLLEHQALEKSDTKTARVNAMAAIDRQPWN